MAKLYIIRTKGGELIPAESLVEALEKHRDNIEKIYAVESEVAVPQELLVRVDELAKDLEGKLTPEELRSLKEKILSIVLK